MAEALGAGNNSNMALQILELEHDRLDNACKHLERSIAELRAAIEAEGPDTDFKEAINDNVVTVAKYRARMASLREEMERVRSGVASMEEGIALTATDDAPAPAAAAGAPGGVAAGAGPSGVGPASGLGSGGGGGGSSSAAAAPGSAAPSAGGAAAAGAAAGVSGAAAAAAAAAGPTAAAGGPQDAEMQEATTGDANAEGMWL